MLQLKDVTKIYKTKSGEVKALNGINLTFPKNGLIFISGKSGCGKTTLLNVIGGLDDVSGGDISLFDKSFSQFTSGDYNDYRNTFVGFIFQEYNLLTEFSVEKNIKMALELQGKQIDDVEVNKVLTQMDILDLKDRKPSELSGGQRQRVAIARALIKNPSIIMADEPTGALDSNTGIQVLDALKELSKDKLVIVVSHDQEFAEKYADRIIRLVDGKVSEDLTVTQKNLESNLYDGGEALLIRQGSTLNQEEKDQIATAVAQGKKLEVNKELTFREKKQTTEDDVKIESGSAVLTKSKMKFSSTLALGVKSLMVKPVRLVITILLAVIAFAVFGLFDTVANFSTGKVMNKLLKQSDATVAVYGEYVLDNDIDYAYDVKVSQKVIDEISAQSGYKVKGVYDYESNVNGYTRQITSIVDLVGSQVSEGKNYYSNYMTGYIEFGEDEIVNNVIEGFNYKIIAGRYPQIIYESNGQPNLTSLKEIAISKYTAESVIHFLGEDTLSSGKAINGIEDLIGEQISVPKYTYTIVGIIDCGSIDDKYEELKNVVTLNKTQYTLADELDTILDAGAQRCFFMAEGNLSAQTELKNMPPYYFSGESSWDVELSDTLKNYSSKYFYSSEGVGEDNIIYFFDDNDHLLADDEILIHPANVKTAYTREYFALSLEDKNRVDYIVDRLSIPINVTEKRQLTEELVGLIGSAGEKTVRVVKTESATKKRTVKDLKIAGIYVDYDDASISSSVYRIMMNENLMKEFKIYTKQGHYSRMILYSANNNAKSKVVTEYMLNEQGFALVWFGNSALSTIQENEAMIRQSADLFLYIALVLAIFSVFMLFNYIATSIVNKRQTIGVLRGLGAGGKDVLFTFLCESLIIALINCVFAIGLTAIGCFVINTYILEIMHISIPFAIFGVRQSIIIFCLSIFTAIISSAIPILKITKEKPVDLIRRA